MKPTIPPLTATAAEVDWIDGEMIRALLRAARGTQAVGFALVPVFVGVLWPHAGLAWLAPWALFALAVCLWRFVAMQSYRLQQLDQAGAAHQQVFMQRHRMVWPLGALAWGLTTALHFDRTPMADQFVCWLVLAGVGMFGMYGFSTHLRTMRVYLNVLALTVLSALMWRIAVQLQFQGPSHHYWLVLLVLLFWQLLLQAGRRLHTTHRRNFELQYRNTQLIDSLTRQTQAALDAVEIKNRFLASAAHDIRQPVHALSLYADWLRSEPELVREIAPKIFESTKAVNALFDSLFDLARLDAGKIKLSIEPVRLDSLLHDLELHYRPLAKAKGLDFRLHVIPGTVTSDPILLQRTIGNLIANAIKYTERGGILVAARGGSTGVPRIEVWDTGVGIAPEHHQEIFREFFKVPAHSGTDDGFGLGLYIVSRLSRILGHPLTFSSRPGRGTVFRLMLEPTDPEQAAQRATASVAALVEPQVNW